MSFLEVDGVGLRYGRVVALEGVSLRVEQGSRLAVVGASGSGKSTLLRILAGFEAPDQGQVRLDGMLLTDGPRGVPAHRRGVGLVAQEGALFPHLSVADNIGFGIGRRERGRTARIAELAALVDLDEALLRRRPDALSGGQQQRVAVARALAGRPRLLLLDEPFSALDTALRAGTREAVGLLLARAGVTTVLVTHDQEEAMSFADQVAVLQDGRLLQAGPPRTLYLQPGSEAVARLLGPALVLPAAFSGGWAECALGRIPVAGAGNGPGLGGPGLGGPGLGGPGRIMLRPEQIELAPAGGADGVGVQAEIVQAQFAGGHCTVSLLIRGGGSLTFRAPQTAVPAAGGTVWLRVSGSAHPI